ncbi:hypothetical protein [Frateuria sp. Soil773]|uniref:hypothetical protein n=1 Tax=Frateuria sp. Soil773 TaxID=1736407 RepID=UPI0012F9DD5F|nr:hypothetical protein [Frateuria sp. Soil773]
MQRLPVLSTFFMVWHMVAGLLGPYWLVSSGATVLQMVLLRRRIRHLSALPATA